LPLFIDCLEDAFSETGLPALAILGNVEFGRQKEFLTEFLTGREGW
jgi:hypothetical protein